LAGGIKDNKKFKTALIGGAAGTFVPESFLDVSMDFESLQEKDAVLGSGAIIVMAEDKSILDMLHSILRFFGHESCGKCVPCRVGTRQLLILLEKIITDGHDNNSSDIDALLEQAELMAKTSLCPLGQSPVLPIKSAMRYFRNELEQTTNYSGGPLI
jgi:NADH:ubiquinone oxidoreductase subunit F (NADH-binding)